MFLIPIFFTYCFMQQFSPAFGLECFCKYHCPEESTNNTCYTNYKCFATVEYLEGTKIKEYRYGCVIPEFEGGIFLCRQKHIEHEVPMVFKCCNDQPRCNEKLKLEIPIEEQIRYENNVIKVRAHHKLIMFTVCCILSVIGYPIIGANFYLRYIKKTKQLKCDKQVMVPDDIEENSTCLKPKMVQRSFTRDITIIKEIGKGRFSVVYVGSYFDQVIAVKVIDKSDKYSWHREQHFYKAGNLCHENILGFIGADILEKKESFLMLITQYHAFGSLQTFLKDHSFDFSIYFRLVHSSLNGIRFLHKPLSGLHGKPAIAHRNISSKNILVKDNLQCCISDLALACEGVSDELTQLNSLYLETSSDKLKLPNPRYMAPEVLKNPYCFNQAVTFYINADMYSFSLVMWEILLRYEINGVAEPYRLPFQEHVGVNPSIDQMTDIINVKKLTPEIPKQYIVDKNTRKIVKSMRQLMDYKTASSRPSSCHLNRNLNKYMQAIIKLSGDTDNTTPSAVVT